MRRLSARAQTPVGRLLKEWRKRRGHSALDLAVAVRTTQRHVSFIGSGRVAPSRDMILRLSAAMDIPLRAAVDLGLCVTHEHWLLCAVCTRSFGDGRLAGWRWREDDRRRTTEQ
jgi:transcriptional regulator with XRE-family HTH domain